MSDIRDIALRIREMRELEGLTEERLAEEMGIELALYSAYESGEADIPISVLLKIAGILDVEPSVLLTGDAPRLHVYTLTRAGKGVSVARREDYLYQSLAYNFGHKAAEPFLVTVEPEAVDSPVAQNAHSGQEFCYCLKGKLRVVINGAEIVLGEGDCIYFDSTYMHGMQAVGGETARFLAIVL